MKRILLSILLLYYFSITSASIGVGIRTDFINVWRYWEKTDKGYEYKIIIFNISDSAVTFKLQQCVINDTTKKNIWIPQITINKSEYKIYDVPFKPDEYMEFSVNGFFAGILPVDSFSVPLNISERKFISHEGLNGNPCEFWITKNNLFTDNNVMDTIFLHLNYEPKINLDKSGVLKLDLSPSREYDFFSAKINNSAAGAFNIKGRYKIELPYHASEYIMKSNKYIDSNPQTDIQIIYSVKLTGKLFLGLEYYCRIDVPDEQMIDKVKSYRGEAAELPVMVR